MAAVDGCQGVKHSCESWEFCSANSVCGSGSKLRETWRLLVIHPQTVFLIYTASLNTELIVTASCRRFIVFIKITFHYFSDITVMIFLKHYGE